MKLAVDLIIYRGDQLLFIRRKHPPFQCELAFPGGFVEEHETTQEAGARELFEETGIQLRPVQLLLFGIRDAVKRDPRGRVVSIVYDGSVPSGTECRGGDDAAEALWLTKAEALAQELAFDHRSILELTR
jgi:8-oxo-dGTP diphosphatase